MSSHEEKERRHQGYNHEKQQADTPGCVPLVRRTEVLSNAKGKAATLAITIGERKTQK